MSEKIRILGIAPYKGIKDILKKAAQNYSQIDLTTIVGDLQQGVDAAQDKFHADYDIVISRGGTAKLLREQIGLPVVEIPISELDMMRAIRLAENVTDKYIVIGFSNITSNAQNLSLLMNVPIQIVTVNNSQDAVRALKEVQAKGYRTVLCDMVTSTAAKELGLNAILITSGIESVRESLDKAVQLYHSICTIKEENHFLRQVIYNQSNETVIFDENNNLYYSTAYASNHPELLKILCSETSSLTTDKSIRIIKSINGVLYNIKGKLLNSSAHKYKVFYFTSSKAPFAINKYGIKYYSLQEAQNHFAEGFYSCTGAIADLEKDIEKINQVTQPVILLGENGTGKEPVATTIYMRSQLNNHPFVTIDCALTNDKTWDFLQNSHNSPFLLSDSTIFLSEIHTLTPEYRSQLFATLVGLDVCRHNRVIFSYVLEPDHSIYDEAQSYIDKFSCLTMHLPSLREQVDKIPMYINLYLSQLNISLSREIIGMDSNAIQKMQEFSWPYNFTQFKRVLQELATMADDNTITLGSVQKILALEKSSPVAQRKNNLPERFDLNRPLETINREIVNLVLAECGGNQSAAAKRLGISRTTMWRYCKF